MAWSLGPGWEEAERRLAERQPLPGGPAAPAGAEAVAARVLERVVAITFTEAAAAEMASRVAEALAAVAESRLPEWIVAGALPPAGPARDERSRALLVALDRLVVCTIHAFCRRLLSRNPVEAGLHPAFTVDADGEALDAAVREVIERWLRSTLAGTPPGEMLELAGRGIGPDRVAEAVTALARAGVPAGALSADPFEPARVVALAGRLADALRAVAGIVGPRLAGSKKARNAARIAAELPGLIELLAAAPSPPLAAIQAALDTALPENLREHLRKWGNGPANQAEEEALGAAGAELARTARTLHRAIKHVLALDEALLGAVRAVVAPLVEEVRQTLRRRGFETFDALLRDARDLLAGHPEVAARERGAIAQLLVDEFQDTDPLQCEIVRLLALAGPPDERPGLFLVGDPKQSIYGWRDADLAAYDAFRDVIAGCGDVLDLTVNFRSAPAILAEVECCVRPVMTPEPGVQPEFQRLLACESRAGSTGFVRGRWAPVEFWVSWPEPGDPAARVRAGEATQIEATALARDIRALHDEAGAGWGGFGVLVRSTGDVDVYLQALRDADIPYVVERDRSYYRRREIIEAAALVRAVLDPADHLALVTVLRSAVVGVPDAALMPLWSRGLPALLTELHHAGRPPPRRGGAGGERRRGGAAGWRAGDRARARLGTQPGRPRGNAGGAAGVVRARHVGGLRRTPAHRDATGGHGGGAPARSLPGREPRTVLPPSPGGRGGNRGRCREHAARAADGGLRAARRGGGATGGRGRGSGPHPHHPQGEGARLPTTSTCCRPTTAAGRTPNRAPRVDEAGEGYEFAALGAVTPGWDILAGRRARTAQAELVRTLYVAMTRARDRLVVAGAWPRGDAVARAGNPSPAPRVAVACSARSRRSRRPARRGRRVVRRRRGRPVGVPCARTRRRPGDRRASRPPPACGHRGGGGGADRGLARARAGEDGTAVLEPRFRGGPPAPA